MILHNITDNEIYNEVTIVSIDKMIYNKKFEIRSSHPKYPREKRLFSLAKEYAFSEFVTASCKRGKVVRLLCKSYKFGHPVWSTNYNLLIQVYVFLITIVLVHHKNKSNNLETRLWKNISHQTLWLNSYGKM